MRVILLSNSCTTGWAHWGHGELWLTPESVVRIGKKSLTRAELVRGGSLFGGLAGGLVARLVIAKMGVNTLGEMDTTQAEWTAYLEGHRKVVNVPLNRVRRYSVKQGLGTSALSVTLRDGQRHKLLWKRNAVAVELLEHCLAGSAK